MSGLLLEGLDDCEEGEGDVNLGDTWRGLQGCNVPGVGGGSDGGGSNNFGTGHGRRR